MTSKEIMGWLEEVVHPAKEGKSIVELGMVNGIAIEEGKVVVTISA